jgi:hypothetical protein
MLSSMKISHPMSLIQCLCHLVYLTFFISDPILVSSSDDDNEDENPYPPAYLSLVESIEDEPSLAPPLPRWICTT